MTVRIRLEPLGVELDVERGACLQAVLAPYGVEFPCGGTSDCEGCRVRRLDSGGVGWQQACRMNADTSMTLEVDQWTASILADDTPVSGGAREGTGVAIDLGTTTIAAQSVDLRTGRVRGIRTALNPQVAYGADVMSRVQLALHDTRLTRCIRTALDGMLDELGGDAVIVGNTAMHHLFCGLDVTPLCSVPFRSPNLSAVRDGRYTFLRCLGGFVGSDILAGIVATGMHRSDDLTALIDLGTNGEIVVGNRRRLVCASAAAGPAFEAGQITHGMRAATGAIAHVREGFACAVIGGGVPRGICGSGLVDAVAIALDAGLLRTNGRLVHGPIRLAGEIALTQADVRELQLAKGAIAAGLNMLLAEIGATPPDLRTIFLAGAFGNYIDVRSGMRIGLLPDVNPSAIRPAGNTALRGARMILTNPSLADEPTVEHIELAASDAFQDEFVSALAFPEGLIHDEQRTSTCHAEP
jgi:uncharacterized 2Fe-2S/4Fe-4S cluster protein (DUF4445 family)